MTIEEFNEYIHNELEKEFDDELLEQFWNVNNTRLKANNKKNYDPIFLWEKVQNIISLSCFLITTEKFYKQSIKSIEICARLLEYLSKIEDSDLDVTFIKIISAFCYDIAGYQANAFCIAKDIEKYEFECNIHYSIKEDNKLIYIMILILQKRIPLARNFLQKDNESCSPFYLTFKIAMLSWFSFILDLKDDNYIIKIHESFIKCLNTNNLYLSTLFQLLEAKVIISEKRSIKQILINENIEINAIWKKYLKLLTNDIYSFDKVKRLETRQSVYEFWVSQICAIKNGLLQKNNKSFIVQMPTSAGKTFIAELFLLNKLIQEENSHVLYISPFNALSNEKEVEFSKRFEKLGFSVSTFPESYEFDIFQDLGLIETDLFISTPEKIDIILRNNKEFFSNISAIVIDEGHIVGDKGKRGQLLEFLIIRLKYYFPEISYLYISAVIPEINAQDFSMWLSNDKNHILKSKQFDNDKHDWMPTRKLICQYKWSLLGGDIIFHNQGKINETGELPSIQNYLPEDIMAFLGTAKPKKTSISAALAYYLYLIGNNKEQVLIFSGYPNRIILVAKELIKLIQFIENLYGESYLKQNTNTASYYYSCKYFTPNDTISIAISYGIGIHYGDLPEQIKKSVEFDYNCGNLKLLICTNTIGQGINFPIKNLILDNVYYNPGSKESKLSINDYNNLVGRAGRAEKETEGLILFVNNSPTDNKDFYYYLTGNNYEIKSCIFSYIADLINNRISEETFYNNIYNLIDTFLIDLLIEEGFTDEDNIKNLIDKIIELSLFSVQCKRNYLDPSITKNTFYRICTNFLQNVPEDDYLLYKDSGLSIETTKLMQEYIRNELEKDGKNDLEKENIIHIFSSFLSRFPVREISEDWKLGNLNINYELIEDFLLDWINGKINEELIIIWRTFGYESESFYVFETRGLNYILPWLLNGFIQVLCKILKIEIEENKELKSLPIYLKYGLPNDVACLSKSLGILSRETCIFLEEQYKKSSYTNFILWLTNLDIHEINSFNIPEYEILNIIQVSKKINPCSNRKQPTVFSFTVKGTFFNDSFKINSKNIKNDSQLTLKRDIENEFDPYAIYVLVDNKPFGYIPKEYSRYICTEIDLNETLYTIKINYIKKRIDYNEINISLFKDI